MSKQSINFTYSRDYWTRMNFKKTLNTATILRIPHGIKGHIFFKH
jgi:hypothetical protein